MSTDKDATSSRPPGEQADSESAPGLLPRVLCGLQEAMLGEEEPEALLERACRVLTDNSRLLDRAWALLLPMPLPLGGSAELLEEFLPRATLIETGLDPDEAEALAAELEAGRLPDPLHALNHGKSLAPLADGGFALALASGPRVHAYLVVRAPRGGTLDPGAATLLQRSLAGLGETLRRLHESLHQERLRQRLDFLDLVLDQISDMIVVTDLDGRIQYVNEAVREQLDRPLEEILGRSLEVLGEDPAEGPTQREIFQTTLREGHWEGEVINLDSRGRPLRIASRTFLVRNSAGRPVALCGVSQDVTARRRGEAERRYLSAIVENTDDMAVVKGPDLRILAANKAYAESVGRHRIEDLIGRTEAEILERDPGNEADDRDRRALALGPHEILRQEQAIDLPDGERRIFLTRRFPILDPAGRAVATACLSSDITEIRQAEETQRQASREQSLHHRISALFLTASHEEVYARVAAELAREFECSCSLFGHIDDNGGLHLPQAPVPGAEGLEKSFYYPPEDWRQSWGRALLGLEAVHNAASEKPPWSPEPLDWPLALPLLHYRRRIGLLYLAGRERPFTEVERQLLERVAEQSAPLLANLLETRRHNRLHEQEARNREELERRLRQAQKMEAIGTLAGGIAHDFNNILSGVLGYSDLALEELKADKVPQAAESIAEVRKAGLRARDLVRQILGFSRQTESRRQPLHLQSMLKESIKLLRGSLPTTIDLRLEIDPDCGPVFADPGQMHQILLNLTTNAFQAFDGLPERPDGDPPRIEVGLEAVQVNTQIAALHPELRTGPHALLYVRDNGPGIPTELQERIFEPYFTTKGQDKGTGLGLATVHGIVQRHGGSLHVQSQPGQGAAFHIYLPLCAPDGAQVAPDQTEADPDRQGRGSERILFADDEEALRNVAQRGLERLGYHVTLCRDGRQALSRLEKSPHSWDLLFTDLTMPGLTGLELARRASRIAPEMPIILCTGYGENLEEATLREAGVHHLALKPLIIAQMAQQIRELMDATRPRH